MDAEVEDRIVRFLTKRNVGIDTIPKSQLAYLERIDSAIQSRVANIRGAEETIRGNAINVSNISDDTGISRGTFYNNELLREYVKSYEEPSDEITISAKAVDSLKEDLNEANQKIYKLLYRDVSVENLRQENIRLQAELQNLKTLNQNYEKNYEELSKKHEELKKKLPPNVIPFDENNK